MDFKFTKINALVMIIFAGALITLFIVLNRQNRKFREQTNLYAIAQDSLVKVKNEKKQEVAKTSVLQATCVKYLLRLKTKDSTITELQEAIKAEKKKNREVTTAIVLKDITIQRLQDSLKNSITGQTIIQIGDSSYVYPTYYKQINDKWISEEISLGYSNFKRDLYVRNEYQIVVGEEPAGLFKRQPYAQITNINPYTDTRQMKVFQQTTVPNKALKAGLIGSGIGASIILILKLLL